MNSQHLQMEALLITGTTFLSRDLCDNDGSRPSSENERLEEACWNGLLPAILPEIFTAPTRENPLYLWDVKTASTFLQLDLGEAQAGGDPYFSIFPGALVSTQCTN